MKNQVSKIPQPGEKSDNVKVMQKALNEKGAGLTVDGDFGPRTKTAVSIFQKSVGLTGTGVPGKQTMKELGIEVVNNIITTGQDPDEGTPPWYRRMFAVCEPLVDKKTQVEKSLAVLDRGLYRYLEVSKRLGFTGEYQILFAYILGALHFKEASGNFNGVLHNGEHIIGTDRKTSIVPIGRGPFSTWEDSAVDAILLNGARWSKLRAGSTDIGDILYNLKFPLQNIGLVYFLFCH